MSTFAKVRKGQEKESDRLHKARLERCVPVAKEVSAILEKLQLPMGDDVQESKEYNDAAVQILQLFLDRDVNWVDREFIFQLALQPLSFVKDLVTNSLQNSWTHTLTGLFGKEMRDLTMNDVNNAMMKAPEDEVEKSEEPKQK